jgi:predicted N-acyltransferase
MPPTLPSQEAIEVRTHSSVADFGLEAWRALTTEDTPPFLQYEWLAALESTQCAVKERGWMPLFLGLWQSGRLLAAAPAYVKGHSMGEFVFDHAWAQFAEQSLGVKYYPKLVVGVPFTPATGPRFLSQPSWDTPRPRSSPAG